MGASETRKVADFPLFDWLRLAMAASVVASHLGIFNDVAGNLAVEVFFALSGWLIGSILIEMDRSKLPLFYFNRATRVWVPYFVALSVLYLASLLHDPITGRWFEFLFYDVTFTHNFFTLLPDAAAAGREMPLRGTGGHFWSIAVEEQFYLIAPLVCLFTRPGRHPLLWLAAGVALIFIRDEFSAICFGVAAAAANRRYPDFHLDRRAVVALVVGVLVTALLLQHVSARPFFAIGVVLLLARPGQRGAIGKFGGAISYPLYLNHWIALMIAILAQKALHWPTPVIAGIGMIAALMIATVAYLAVDRPVLARRSRWYTPARGWVLAAIAYALVTTGIIGGLYMRVI